MGGIGSWRKGGEKGGIVQAQKDSCWYISLAQLGRSDMAIGGNPTLVVRHPRQCSVVVVVFRSGSIMYIVCAYYPRCVSSLAKPRV